MNRPFQGKKEGVCDHEYEEVTQGQNTAHIPKLVSVVTAKITFPTTALP
jgi:hypothetical protein